MLLILFSCKKNTIDYEELMSDRVWFNYKDKDDKSPFQEYYNSKDKVLYHYWKFEERVNPKTGRMDTYTPWELYEGTPESNPLKTDSFYKGGWADLDNFKFEGNQVIRQDKKDVKGENLSVFFLEQKADTTIGIFKYNQVIVRPMNKLTGKPKDFYRIMVSKIE